MVLFEKRTLEEQTNSLAYHMVNGELTDARFVDGSNLRKYLRGLAAELQRFYSILETSATELDLEQTQALIKEWESALGIPGSCFGTDGTLEERRLHMLMKLNELHGTTEEDFIRVAELLGYTVSVIRCKPHAVFPMEFPLYVFSSGKAATFTMLLELPYTNEPELFPLTFPIAFAGPQNQLLECLFNRIKPTFTRVIFSYTGPA